MTKQKFIEVVNFEKFQHYKNRNPPWIKLYYSLFSDYEFSELPDSSKFHLIAIYMVASRNNNCIPNNPEWLIKETKSKASIDLNPLIDANFIKFCARKKLAKEDKNGSKALFTSYSYSYSGNTLKIEGVTDEDIQDWKSKFNLVDVPSEILKMEVWLESNESKRWTNIKRGMINWFDRAQKQERDRGSKPIVSGSGSSLYDQELAKLGFE